MKERLEEKITEILNYIISKPVEQITNEDFTILAGELRDIRYREGEAERNKKFADSMTALMSSSTLGYSSR